MCVYMSNVHVNILNIYRCVIIHISFNKYIIDLLINVLEHTIHNKRGKWVTQGLSYSLNGFSCVNYSPSRI